MHKRILLFITKLLLEGKKDERIKIIKKSLQSTVDNLGILRNIDGKQDTDNNKNMILLTPSSIKM